MEDTTDSYTEELKEEGSIRIRCKDNPEKILCRMKSKA